MWSLTGESVLYDITGGDCQSGVILKMDFLLGSFLISKYITVTKNGKLHLGYCGTLIIT